MTLSPWSARGICRVLPFLSSGCHSTTSTALCCRGSLAHSDKVCPRQGCQLQVLLRVPSLGIRGLPGALPAGEDSLFKSRPHCICFSWPCSSPALTSSFTLTSWTAPSGSFPHLSAFPSWRDREGDTILFSLTSSPFSLTPPSRPQFSLLPPSPFSQPQSKSFRFYD